ncbi:three-helix bundle dimerization domain-containing protein [Actinokineospora bangkokensis]|uniref:Uncharacterized protein n=1 Tax=Actinokineospora bangkokensis TaxID=1193682 RepID=A0A1Q9LKH8_9PSEU|nr:hypothetical protein [Actinokineospora bangkokensis]OLR92504.1 hypothetical protein BJP25_20770 [Actinokineospora bangkokensis]
MTDQTESTIDALTSEGLDAHKHQLGERLAGAYQDVPEQQVRARVNAGFERFEDAKVHAFVPILVERRVRAELDGA